MRFMQFKYLGLLLLPILLMGISDSGVMAAGKGSRDRYYFNRLTIREKKWPGFDNALMIIKNDKKQRHTWIVGDSVDGHLTVSFPDTGSVDNMMDSPEMAALMGYGKTTGSCLSVFRIFSCSRPEADKYAAADLIKLLDSESRGPTMAFELTDIKGWSKDEKRSKKRKPGETSTPPQFYHATVTGELANLGKVDLPGLGRGAFDQDVQKYRDAFANCPNKVKVTFAATISLHDAQAAKEGMQPGSIHINGTAKNVDGGKLGLTGDDAGPLNIFINTIGFTDFLAFKDANDKPAKPQAQPDNSKDKGKDKKGKKGKGKPAPPRKVDPLDALGGNDDLPMLD